MEGDVGNDEICTLHPGGQPRELGLEVSTLASPGHPVCGMPIVALCMF